MNNYEQRLQELLRFMGFHEEEIDCTFDFVQHPDDQKALIDFIEAGDDVDMETVMIRAVDLSEQRN